MSKVLLSLKNISKTFPGVKALNNVSFDILENEVHVLVGENGAGKSTLIKTLTGVYQPDQGGELFFQGKSVQISDTTVAKSIGISVRSEEHTF